MPARRITSTKNVALPTFSKKKHPARSVSTKQSVPSSGGKRPWAKDCNCEALSICWEVRWGLSLSSLDFRRVQGTQPVFQLLEKRYESFKRYSQVQGGQSHSHRRSQCWKQSLRNRVVYVAHRLKNPTKDFIVKFLTVVKYWNEITWNDSTTSCPLISRAKTYIPQYVARGCAHLKIPFPFTL